jgi:hypothetical protein
VQRDAKEVMAEVLRKLTARAAPDAGVVSGNGKKDGRGNTVGPNRDRLTVGVDLGDRWSQYCILGLEGETLAEGQLRTTQEDVGEFFRGLTTTWGAVKGQDERALFAGALDSSPRHHRRVIQMESN